MIIYEGSLGANKYVEILEKAKPSMKKCFRRQNWTFLHNGASSHKAKLTNDWLEENVPNHITSGPTGEWPAKSPDLNPIENIWAMMDTELEVNPLQTTAELKRRIKKIWRELTVDKLKNSIDSMPKRLKAVLKNKGEYAGK